MCIAPLQLERGAEAYQLFDQRIATKAVLISAGSLRWEGMARHARGVAPRAAAGSVRNHYPRQPWTLASLAYPWSGHPAIPFRQQQTAKQSGKCWSSIQVESWPGVRNWAAPTTGHPVIRCNVNSATPALVAVTDSVILADRLVTSHQDSSSRASPIWWAPSLAVPPRGSPAWPTGCARAARKAGSGRGGGW